MTTKPPVTAIPDYVRKFTNASVTAQRVKWNPVPWKPVFADHTDLYDKLSDHAAKDGISRDFVHQRAGGDPVELFLGAMAWGFGLTGYGAARTKMILRQPDAEKKLGCIVDTVRTKGALCGWDALLLPPYKVKGLGMAFGTKLLYFAGYRASVPGPRPLILDALVRASLQDVTVKDAFVPATSRVWRAAYGRYLDLAEAWAAESSWHQEPDVVELALFEKEWTRRADTKRRLLSP